MHLRTNSFFLREVIILISNPQLVNNLILLFGKPFILFVIGRFKPCFIVLFQKY